MLWGSAYKRVYTVANMKYEKNVFPYEYFFYLLGILSKHYHKIVEKLEKSGLPAVPAKGLKVLTPIEITQMFSEDVSSQDIN